MSDRIQELRAQAESYIDDYGTQLVAKDVVPGEALQHAWRIIGQAGERLDEALDGWEKAKKALEFSRAKASVEVKRAEKAEAELTQLREVAQAFLDKNYWWVEPRAIAALKARLTQENPEWNRGAVHIAPPQWPEENNDD